MTPQRNKNAFKIINALIAFCLITFAISGIYFAKKILRENDVKALIMQIKKYDTAINNFSEKYHALPGDITGSQEYGITEFNSDGNGDNVITDRNLNIISANGEISKFWFHLSASQMIDENYDGKEDVAAKTPSTFPLSRLGEKVGIVAFGFAGKTFYQIGFDSADTQRIYTKNRALKTTEAFLVDKKIDDGNPKKGRVIVAGGNELNFLQNNTCIKFDEYNQNISDTVCQLRVEVK